MRQRDTGSFSLLMAAARTCSSTLQLLSGPGYVHSTRDKLSSTRSRAIGAKSPRSTSGSSSCLGWWKLLNIGAIGLRLVESEKVGAYPSTCQAPRACYRIAPPISKRVAETQSLPRLKGLPTAALRRGD